MDIAFDSQKEHPLDFPEGLSLQALAATKVALCLWQYKICRGVTQQSQYNPTYWLVRHRYWFEGINVFSCQEILTVPTRIRNLIDEQIVPVREELRILLNKFALAWTEFSLPNDRGDLLITTLFDNVVLKPDNTICLVSSARNTLIRLPLMALNAKSKYKLACEFCVEDCVRLYWPIAKYHFDARKQLNQSWLVLYWSNIMKGNVVYLSRFSLSERNPDIELAKENNSAAFAFFWNKFDEEMQISLTIYSLQNRSMNYCTVNYLLANLNEMQARRVCEISGYRILCKMMIADLRIEYTMNYWIYMKDFISGRSFYRIISSLWRIVLNNSELHRDAISRRGALLREIWVTASDQLKAAILKSEYFEFLFASLRYRARRVYNPGVEFVLALLHDANFAQRHAVWLFHWREFIVRFEPSKLEELMKLCLANEEEIQQFKDRRMANFQELRNHFSSWIERKLITELCQYLNFCVKDPLRLENFTKEIILSNLHTILSCNGENELAMYHSLIHGTFRDSQSADKFIEELILAPEFLALIYSKLDDGSFHEVIRMSARFPTSERNFKEIKMRLVNHCNDNLARGKIAGFFGLKLENFLNWCSLDNTLISEFKQSLVIDDIFAIIMKRNIRRISRRSLDLNNFLVWYFGSAEKAKIYKSSESVDRLLKYAFRNDTNKINRVKNMLQK